MDQEKAKTKTWSDVVKGMKIEDELETTNSDKMETNRRQPIRRNVRFGDTESLEGQVDERVAG